MGQVKGKAHNFRDESGNRYGQLKVLHRVADRVQKSGNAIMYDCLCDCGRHTTVEASHLRRGHTTHCKLCGNSVVETLVGTTIGSLTAKNYHAGTHTREGTFDCTCVCGKTCMVPASAFKKGSACPDCANTVKEIACRTAEEESVRIQAERIAARKAEVAARMVHGEADCHVCGVHFEYTCLPGQTRPYCSETCRKKRRMALRRHMYRARAAGSLVVLPVDPYEIFARDKYVCGICHQPAPQSLQGTDDPMAPEIDHVRSFRLGGFNTPENMRCVHNACQKIKNLDVDAAWATVYDKKTRKWVGLTGLVSKQAQEVAKEGRGDDSGV